MNTNRPAPADKPNLMTPTGLVHAAKTGINPYSGQRGPSPKCGKSRARYLIPTDQPITCKRCLGH